MYTNKQIWNVSYPIFFSLLAQNVINLTDTAFLGRVGEVELGAAAMGGLFYICIFTVAFGFSTGSQIMMARRNGEERHKEMGPIMIQGILFLFAVAFIVFSLSKAFVPQMMRFLVSSDKIKDATVTFLEWRVYGFFFGFVNVMFRAFYVSITRTKVLTIGAVLMASVNVVLNYLLIFGHYGFPQLGIKGAAIASVVAEATAMIFFLIYTYLTVDLKKYGLTKLRSFDVLLLVRVLSISCFTMLQYFLSMATWFIFFLAVERLGQRELAVANIVRSIYVLMLIPVHALSTTTNTFVSNLIGAGKIGDVMPAMNKIARLSFFVMLALVASTTIFPEAFVGIYTNEAALISESISSVHTISVAMLIASVANIYFNGISGTGNTRSALLLESITLTIYVLYVFGVVVFFKAPVHICFSTEILYYTLLLVASFIYLKKANWQSKKI